MATNGNSQTIELPDGMRIEEIPKARRGRKSYVWSTRLAPLVEHPGVEVRVFDGFKNAVAATRTATNLKKGRLVVPQGDPEEDWKFAARTITVDDEGNLCEPGQGEVRYALYAAFHPKA